MITRIEVDGFKSLVHFHMDLLPGLNILVGPNGSGKTNIVSFFEFISNLPFTNLNQAVSNIGGAGLVFQKHGENSINTSLKASIYGNVKVRKDKFISYRYSFTINASQNMDFIYFKEQEISMFYGKFISSPHKIDNWDLILRQESDSGTTQTIELFKYNRRNMRSSLYYPDQRLSGSKFKKHFEVSMRNYLGTNDSILIPLPRFIERGYYVSNDIRCGETFNIIPSSIRMVENSARPPGIAKDGSGLAATLYAMVNETTDRRKKMFFHRTYRHRPEFKSTRTIKDLVNYIKLANSSISDIRPYNDPFENQIKLVFTIKDGEYEAFLPMSAMSDGTLKWITLITAVMTSESLFSVEEPENYLHPQMQSEILSIMRTSTKEKDSLSCVIMTTHSETLLNSARPEEIIVTHFENGCTIASRPKNKDILNNEIKKTGFGLGYYYLAGALDDA